MRRATWVCAAVVTGLMVVAPAARADLTPDYFPLPSGYSYGDGIDTSPDGVVYFGAAAQGGDPNAPRPPIVTLDPALALPGTSNGMTFAPTPPGLTSTAQIRAVSYSVKDHTLYWTRSDGVVGRADGSVMQSTTTSGQVGAWGIAADPTGGAWLTEYDSRNTPPYYGGRPAHLSAGAALDETLPDIAHASGNYDLRYDSKPKGIAVTPDGKPWFAESDPGNPGWRIATAGTGYTEYSLPCVTPPTPCSGAYTGTGVSDVALAPDGSIWFTDELNRRVGHMTPGASTTEYALTGLSGVPKRIRAAADGTYWVAVLGGYLSGSNAIVHVIPNAGGAAPQAVVYKTPGFEPYDLAPDTHGHVWFVGQQDSGGAKIGRFTVGADDNPGGGGGGGGGTTTTPPATTPAPPQPPATTLTPTVTAAATVTLTPPSNDSISANQICVGPPQDRCSLIYLIQTHEYVTGFPGSKSALAAKAKPKSKLVTIGKATFTLKGGQSKKVTVKLNSAGRKLLKKNKKLKSTLTVTQSINGGKAKKVLSKTVTFKQKKGR